MKNISEIIGKYVCLSILKLLQFLFYGLGFIFAGFVTLGEYCKEAYLDGYYLMRDTTYKRKES